MNTLAFYKVFSAKYALQLSTCFKTDFVYEPLENKTCKGFVVFILGCGCIILACKDHLQWKQLNSILNRYRLIVNSFSFQKLAMVFFLNKACKLKCKCMTFKEWSIEKLIHFRELTVHSQLKSSRISACDIGTVVTSRP